MTRHPEDDEPTRRDLSDEVTAPGYPAPTYDHAPPTMEMRPSPFHPIASAQPTTPGMPSPFAIDPVITAMPAGGAVVPPRIVGAPAGDITGSDMGGSDMVGSDMAGPTDPDGYPLTDSWEGPGNPHHASAPLWIDAGPTDVSAVPRVEVKRVEVKPQVPAPDAPKIEVSQSLMLESEEVQTAVRAAKAKTRAQKRRPRHHVPQEGPGAAAPTYQMLPALKRKQAKEGSDWPLILGLVALALIIAGVIGVGAYFATRSLDAETPNTVNASGGR